MDGFRYELRVGTVLMLTLNLWFSKFNGYICCKFIVIKSYGGLDRSNYRCQFKWGKVCEGIGLIIGRTLYENKKGLMAAFWRICHTLSMQTQSHI